MISFDREIRICFVRNKAGTPFETVPNFKCEQSSTGSFVTYSDGRSAARLRSSSLNAVQQSEA